jgi:hypothetical protein
MFHNQSSNLFYLSPWTSKVSNERRYIFCYPIVSSWRAQGRLYRFIYACDSSLDVVLHLGLKWYDAWRWPVSCIQTLSLRIHIDLPIFRQCLDVVSCRTVSRNVEGIWPVEIIYMNVYAVCIGVYNCWTGNQEISSNTHINPTFLLHCFFSVSRPLYF